MEKSEYYVYVHKRASDGQPFYYGRGKDRRAWEPYRNPWHANIVAKHGVIVEILQTGLTRDEGSALEKQLIKAAKEAGGKLCNMTDGGEHLAGCKARDLKTGFHDPKYAGAGGKRTAELKVGAFSPEIRRKTGSKVGKITGKLPWWHVPSTGQQKRSYESPSPEFVRDMGPRKPRGKS